MIKYAGYRLSESGRDAIGPRQAPSESSAADDFGCAVKSVAPSVRVVEEVDHGHGVVHARHPRDDHILILTLINPRRPRHRGVRLEVVARALLSPLGAGLLSKGGGRAMGRGGGPPALVSAGW
jgi:hypothetical protein